jgi:hypothetical protein
MVEKANQVRVLSSMMRHSERLFGKKWKDESRRMLHRNFRAVLRSEKGLKEKSVRSLMRIEIGDHLLIDDDIGERSASANNRISCPISALGSSVFPIVSALLLHFQSFPKGIKLLSNFPLEYLPFLHLSVFPDPPMRYRDLFTVLIFGPRFEWQMEIWDFFNRDRDSIAVWDWLLHLFCRSKKHATSSSPFKSYPLTRGWRGCKIASISDSDSEICRFDSKVVRRILERSSSHSDTALWNRTLNLTSEHTIAGYAVENDGSINRNSKEFVWTLGQVINET